MNIVEEIGMPAVLEQCAEECVELAHACLKMARKMRNENPTPMKKNEIWSEINEEVADVEVCLDMLLKAGLTDKGVINSNKIIKKDRWKQRIAEFKEKEKERRIG